MFFWVWPGFHVLAVAERSGRRGTRLRVEVESAPGPMGCHVCGVIAYSHGRRDVELVDIPCFGRPVQVVWRKRTWRCAQPGCAGGSFTEQNDALAPARALLTTRACWWAIGQIRREHASVAGIARALGTWNTVWRSIAPLLRAMAADESRFDGVKALGVDEHIWHHVSTKPPERGGRGPNPFHGYENAIDDQLEDAVAVLDAFHVVKLGTQAVDEVRRRVQQDTAGHRARKGRVPGVLPHRTRS